MTSALNAILVPYAYDLSSFLTHHGYDSSRSYPQEKKSLSLSLVLVLLVVNFLECYSRRDFSTATPSSWLLVDAQRFSMTATAPRHDSDGSNDLVLIPRWHQRLTALTSWRRPPSSTRLDGPSIATSLDLRASRLRRRSLQLRRGLLQGSTKAVLAQASQGGVTPPRQRDSSKAAMARAPARQRRCGLLQGGVSAGSSSSGGAGSFKAASVQAPQTVARAGSFKVASVRAPQAAAVWAPSRQRRCGLLKQWRRWLQGAGLGSGRRSVIFLFLKINFSCVGS
jgi:hypothetical protein